MVFLQKDELIHKRGLTYHLIGFDNMIWAIKIDLSSKLLLPQSPTSMPYQLQESNI